MRYLPWAGVFFVLSAALLFIWLATALQENCGNVSERWLCGSLLQDTLLPVLPYAFIVASLITVLLLVAGIAQTIKNRL